MSHLYKNEAYLDQLAKNNASKNIERQIHRTKLLAGIQKNIQLTKDARAAKAMLLMLELILDGQC